MSSPLIFGISKILGIGSIFNSGIFIFLFYTEKYLTEINGNIKQYWAGSCKSLRARSVAKFLYDYDLFCQSVSDCLKVGGKAILIVGRRSTGGFRLKLDKFTIDRLEKRGFRLVCSEERPLSQKRFPSKINRYARSLSETDRENGKVVTMQSEIILVMEKIE
jgi:site-specific DNA-methyltransferase (cytosine-N4-specific)